ncbi:hypothetical protein [Polaromonas sp.]|uniref:HNH endonuclease n=1 Tax=Polaromonas sp. TaxID=1869339 RepID=UPI00286C79AD|nr:hypothetical protein [Polaromonas sp.]
MDKRLDEIAEAEAIFVDAMPDRNEREIVLRQLLRSADVANAIAPSAWAVTLLRDGFRLNVGQVEVLVFKVGIVRMNIAGHVGAAPFVGEGFFGANYRSLSKPQCAFEGDALQLKRVVGSIQAGHDRFIRLAALTAAGIPRKGTPFRRSHSEGLMLYARNFLASDASEVDRSDEWVPQEEMVGDNLFVEGARLTVQVNAFERNPKARAQCLAHYGMRCAVCDFSFEAVYGPVANSYIHVHHLKPLASIGKEYVVDPLVDLRPVCANCHAVIHLRMPPYEIDEVRAMLYDVTGGTQR